MRASAAPLPPCFEGVDAPALTAALSLTGTAVWDDIPVLPAQSSHDHFKLFEPGAAYEGALSWEALNDAANSLDFAALPEPDSPPDKLTRFIVILFVLGAVCRYFTSKAWDDFISDVYYPRSY